MATTAPILDRIGSFNIGQADDNFNRTATGFSSGGGGFGGSFQEGQIIQMLSGSVPTGQYFVFKNGQIHRLDGVRKSNKTGNENIQEQAKIQQEVESQTGQPVNNVQGNVLGDFYSLAARQGVKGFNDTNINLSDVKTFLNQAGSTETPYDPNNAFYQRSINQLPAQQFSNGRYLAGGPDQPTSAVLGASTNQPSQPGFQDVLQQVYLSRPDLRAVYDQNGNAINPNDPKVAGIPTLTAWAQKYGVNEIPALKQVFNQQTGNGVISGQTVPGSDNTQLADINNLNGQQTPQLGAFTELFRQQKAFLDKLQARGQAINPNVTITPERLAEFTKQAESEINPYYISQSKLARESILNSFGYSRDEILNQEKQLEKQYGRSLRSLGEASAEQGFAQSGIRNRQESELAQDTQNQIDTRRRSLSFEAGNQARQFAKEYGGSNLPELANSFNGLSRSPQVLAGERNFDTSANQKPFYQLSPDVYDSLVGSQEYAQRGNIANRASQLESADRQKLANEQLRQLTF